MKKYIVGENLKQGDECIILDNVVHRVEKLESERCECPSPFKPGDHFINGPNNTKGLTMSHCLGCLKPIKPN